MPAATICFPQGQTGNPILQTTIGAAVERCGGSCSRPLENGLCQRSEFRIYAAPPGKNQLQPTARRALEKTSFVILSGSAESSHAHVVVWPLAMELTAAFLAVTQAVISVRVAAECWQG